MNTKTAHLARKLASWPLLLGLLLCFAVAPAEAWWNPDWQYRKKIMLDTSPSGAPLKQNLAEFPVLLRLHSGNFNYFLNTKAEGDDLRFIASDDKTPLKFHIENFDNMAGLATIWVQVPSLNAGAADAFFWMYYGNETAPSASDAAGTYDVSTVAVYHLDERSGLPMDSSAYSSNASESSLLPGQPGNIDFAAGFSPSTSMTVPSSPVLGVSAGKGFSAMAWIKLTKSQDKGMILSQADDKSGFSLEVAQNTLTAQMVADRRKNKLQVSATAPLAVDRWHHVGITVGADVKLFVDGEPVSSAANTGIVIPPAHIHFGASTDGNGFSGLMDEVQISNVERSADWIEMAAKGQGPDGKLVAYGQDESKSDESGAKSGYLMLWMTLAKAVSTDGWIIIGITMIIGLLAFDVMIGRFILLRQVTGSDDQFVDKSREIIHSIFQIEDSASRKEFLNEMAQTYRQSAIFRVFRAGVEESERIFELAAARGAAREMTAEGLEAIRSGLNVTIVSEENRLNAKMVMVTVAISGAPFLGLLGTVVGVMMTFATIAATGDVNVNTIAPGVASAMATTVVGLFVAIPCMFGYNYLATLISKRMAAMEVFADQLVSVFAMTHSSK